MEYLKDKLVFITGASSGIGASCAEAFARHGARLLLCARREARLQTLADRLHTTYGTAVHTLLLDVREAVPVEQALAALPASWQAIDVLVNNAGLALSRAKTHEHTLDDIDAMIDTNVKGLLYVTRAVVPGMVARGNGHVVNIGSTAGHEVYPGGAVYCASKHAVDAITKGLKMDLLGTRVRVSTVDPGLVETEFSVVRFYGNEGKAQAVYAGIKPLTPDDVADAVLYCASRPSHVNINEIVMMPVAQSSSLLVHREKTASENIT